MLIPNLRRIFKYDCNGKYKMHDIDRFISRVIIDSSACWIFDGCSNEKGYRYFSYSANHIYSHRASYEIANGVIIGELMCVCHKCDNPSCVRPDHLWLGTNHENTLDKVAKGRCNAPKGSDHGMAKLTWDEVNEIRRLWNAGNHTMDGLALQFNTSCSIVSRITTNQIWVDESFVRNNLVNHRKKLTQDIVNNIRSTYALGGYSQQKLADMFSVTQTCVGLIVNNKRWVEK